MASETLSTVTAANTKLAGKYLTFMLGREGYGISVLKVREIIRLIAVTAVPQMPAYVKGVINLRGKIIPVVDMRIKFCLEHAESTESNCIIVVQVRGPHGTPIQMGLVVDAVDEVIQITATDIEDTPEFGCQMDTRYILGMAKIKGLVKALLDLDRVVTGDTLEKFSEV